MSLNNEKIPKKVLNELEKIENAMYVCNESLKKATVDYDRQKYATYAKALMKKYRVLRGKYDVLYFVYEYFSEERNPDNEGNIIPKGANYEDAAFIHRELCETLDSVLYKKNAKLVWSIPRGHAKSAYMSNGFPVHQIVYDLQKFILLITETSDLGETLIKWISEELKNNQKLREDFGILMNTGLNSNVKDTGEGFITLNGIMVKASSTGKRLRGTRHGSHRPSLVICDDLESTANTNTKELREKNLHWFTSVVLPIGNPESTAFIYMGTLVHGLGLLPAVMQMPEFESKLYSAIKSPPTNPDLWMQYEDILRDIDNPNCKEAAEAFYQENQEKMDEGVKTLWEQRWSYKRLMIEKVTVGSRSFSSEYLNVPSDSDSQIFKSEYFTFFDDRDLYYNDGRPMQLNVYGFWDLSLGKSSRADYNAIVFIGVDKRTGIIYVLEAWASKIALHKALELCLQKIEYWRPRMMGVEAIQSQYEIYRQLREKAQVKGLYNTRIYPVYTKTKKEERIEMLEPLIENSTIRFRHSQRLLREQLEQFPNGDSDDVP
jgi:predicted phage terminase large subunit-like protein